jgi:hypothetical protein
LTRTVKGPRSDDDRHEDLAWELTAHRVQTSQFVSYVRIVPKKHRRIFDHHPAKGCGRCGDNLRVPLQGQLTRF